MAGRAFAAAGRDRRRKHRCARGDLAGAETDSERALEAARLAKDAQVLAPALQASSTVRFAQGRRDEADAFAGELVALGPRIVPSLAAAGPGVLELAWLAVELGRGSEVLALLGGAPEVPWVLAARSAASGDWERAAGVLDEIECPPAQAYARLRAAQRLVAAGKTSEAEASLDASLRFYESVGAIRFVREGEGLRARLAEAATARSTEASAG